MLTDAQLDARFPVCLVGVGACTPVGLNAPMAAAAVRAAITGIADHPFMIDKAGEPMAVARVATIDEGLQGVPRSMALLQPALDEALTPILISHLNRAVPLALGLPEQRPGLPNDFGELLAHEITQMGRFMVAPFPVTLFPHGHASGLMAVDAAAKSIVGGRVELALAGAVDSYLLPESLEWLDELGQLKSAMNRSAFVPGEGAGVILLASTAAARRLKLPILAWYIGSGSANEPCTIKSENVCVGLGLADAIRAATSGLRLPEERIDRTYCDLNGERYRSEEYQYALLKTQSLLVKNQNFLHPADCWGDVGAASGPLFGALAVESARRGYANGPRVLLWASSEGGQRSATVFHLSSQEVAL